MTPPSKALKKKPWTSKKADQEFSKFIRERDKRCVNCGRTTNLTCSHFWNRNISSLRYDPRNCDTLCWLPCHATWEKQKQGKYMEMKQKQLGQKVYDELRKLAFQSRMNRREAILGLMKLLGVE